MTDLALRWDAAAWCADLVRARPGLATDDGLRTAIIVSLFTDRAANDDDPLPAPGDRRGWWGDALPTIEADRIGSRLWLLRREKRLGSVLGRARDYAAEALAWLITDAIASAVDVTAELIGDATIGLLIEITRPGGPGRLRFDFTWDATA